MSSSRRDAPPFDEEAERAVLGAALVDLECLNQVAGILGPGDFYLDQHRIVYEACLGLLREGGKPDLLSVTDRLRKTQKLELCGGAPHVSELVDAFPDLDNVQQYADIVRDYAQRRKLIAAARKLIIRLQEGTPFDGALNAFRARLGEGRSNGANPWESTQGVSWADAKDEEYPSEKRLIGPMVRPSWLHLYGAAGSAKTFASLGIGLALATGTNLLEWQAPEAVKVLYIDGELGRRLVQSRVGSLIEGHSLDEDLAAQNFNIEAFDRQAEPLPYLDRPEFRLIREKYPEVALFIIDNVRTLASPDFIENDVESWNNINENLKYLRADGASILTNHHGNRAGGFNGSAAQGTLADLLLKIERHTPAGVPSPSISFKVEKNRHGIELPAARWKLIASAAGGLRWVDDGPANMPDVDPGEDLDHYRARIVDAVSKMPKVGKNKLYRAVGGKYDRFDTVLGLMVADGIVCRKIAGQRHSYWLPEPSPTDGAGNSGVTVRGDGYRYPSPSNYPLTGDSGVTVAQTTVTHHHPPSSEGGGVTVGDNGKKQGRSTLTAAFEKWPPELQAQLEKLEAHGMRRAAAVERILEEEAAR